MQRVPNWYRWLLIAGATLIMCSCRAPLIAPGLTDLPLVATTESGATPPIDSTDTVTTQNHGPSEGRKLATEEAVGRKFIHDVDERRRTAPRCDQCLIGGSAGTAVDRHRRRRALPVQWLDVHHVHDG